VETTITLPPIRIVKNSQALITLHTKDFSFVEDEIVAEIFNSFSKANLKLNMMQQGAISFEAVVDNIPEKIEKVKLIYKISLTFPLKKI
jgi:aspartate kinase